MSTYKKIIGYSAQHQGCERYTISKSIKKIHPEGWMKRSKRLSPLSTVERAIDNKLKQVIENRKHEKITNERG